jgi:hypothetical protein
LKEPEDYDPESIGRIDPGILDAHPSVAFDLGANVDVLFRGDGDSPPSTVILDYVYGVAAYNAWQSKRDGDFEAMTQYREGHYTNITPVHTPNPDEPDPPDDPNDETYDPHQSQKRSTRKGKRGEDESDLAKAMDKLNRFLMHIHGITPEEAAKRRQKEIEQEERAAQEASQSKVTEWIKGQDVH